jgi:hypothetical protein
VTAEIATLVGDATPYVTAALAAYGTAVLAKIRDDTADAAVGVGRRLLQRVFGRRKDGEPLPVALAEVVSMPDDPDALAALRLVIRKKLQDDAEMLTDVRRILVSGQPMMHAPTIYSGRDTYYSAHDITINRSVD